MASETAGFESSFLARCRLGLPLYLGLAAMVSASVLALGDALSSPDFALRLHVLALAGIALSFLGACTGRSPALIGAVIAVFVVPMLVLSNAGGVVTEFFFPSESLSDHTLLLPTLAVWGIAALSFAQANRGNSIFIFVCGLVVFGLTGTVNLNESLLVAFLVFLLSTCFVWGYGNLLAQREYAVGLGQTSVARPRRWAHTQVGVGLALTGIVFVIAVAVGYPSYRYIPSFFIGPFARQYQRLAAQMMVRNYTGFERQFSLTGGAIRLSDNPVMTVKSKEPLRWRGVVYDSYDSHGWSQTVRDFWIMGPARRNGLEGISPRAEGLRPSGKTRQVWQHFALQAPTGALVLAGAQPVAFMPDDHPRQATIDGYGCLRSSRPVIAGTSYTVVSAVLEATEKQLAAAPTTYPSGVRSLYLGVPPLTRRKLQALADEITAGCRNPYEKAEAIQQHLYETCGYTLDVPPIPNTRDADAVAYFVQVSKKGACDLYASSLAVLLRLSGVPARVAVGFASGKYDAEARAYRVLESDAHAWTEVYFSGIGWVDFDPPSQPAPQHTSWLAKLFEPGWAGPTLRDAGWKALAVLIALLLVNALILAVVGVSPAALLRHWGRRRQSARNPRQRVALAYEGVCRVVGRRRVGREPWQTPAEFLSAAREAGGRTGSLPWDKLARFSADFERLRYGAAEPAPRDLARFELRATALARRIRGGGRRR